MNIKIFLVLSMIIMLTSALKLASHDGQYAWYTFNEGPTGNRCKDSNQCDGQRTCSPFGWCQGTSRPAKNANYRYNEAVTGNKCPNASTQPNFANRAYYCDGNRSCSVHGWCQGTSR